MRDYSVSSIKKALDVLEYLKCERVSTFSRMQTELGFAKSTTYQILKTLENASYISINAHGEYSLGYKLFELGNAFGQNISWRGIIAPFIKEISNQTELTVHVSILTKSLEAICIEKIPGKLFTMQLTEVGAPVQMSSSASGKVLLAWQPPEMQEKILQHIAYPKFTEYTIATKEELQAELCVIKQRGYAFDNRESEENCRGVGVPLFACDGSLLASVSVGAPIILMEENQMLTNVEILQRYTAKMSPLLNPGNANF